MIASAMGYVVVVSVLATAAAWIAEDGLRRLGAPTRWIWLVAMGAPVVLLGTPLVLPSFSSTGLTSALGLAPVVELAPLLVNPNTGFFEWGWLAPALVIGWGAMSVGMLGLLTVTHRHLLAQRARWEPSTVLGRDVYVSADRGPAVAGIVRPWIVLPRWTLGLPESQLGYVLIHEEEHVRGADSALLAAALFLVVLVPWNPVTWWQLRRLRMAMEMDCDRRVLRRAPDRELYGKSLLSVAARASGASLGLATFTERSLSLKRRIIAMTARSSRWNPLRAAALVLVASVIGVQACAVESPVGAASAFVAEESGGGATSNLDISSEPTFTPFTVAPAITNRREVVDAMVAEYPPLLRDAGVGGTVRVFFFVNELGIVEKIQIDESSGHPALDDAAVAVGKVYRFSPAMNKEDPVPVWVSFPITFQVR